MYYLLIILLVSVTGDIIWVEPTTHFPTEANCMGQAIDDAALVATAKKQWGYGPTEVKRVCAPVPAKLVHAGQSDPETIDK